MYSIITGKYLGTGLHMMEEGMSHITSLAKEGRIGLPAFLVQTALVVLCSHQVTRQFQLSVLCSKLHRPRQLGALASL
jgi:hypothetical protein